MLRDVSGSLIIVQSNQKDTEFILHRIQVFINEVMKPIFEEMSDEVFTTAAQAVLVSKQEKDVALKVLLLEDAFKLTTHRYLFTRKETES